MKEKKSYYPKKSDIQKNWIVIDATNKVLGRLASEIAKILRGKHKPTFTPSADLGDFVIVTNVEKIIVTGNKESDKTYYSHSGYPGGLKSITYKELKQKDATKALYSAIKGMLPHNSLGRQVMKHVKIVEGSEHPHDAQNPVELDVAI